MKISSSELDVLRSKSQTMQYKIEIYDSDDTLIDTLTDIENFAVAMAEAQFVRRTFRMAVNNKDQEYTFNKQAHGDNFYWYDKTLKFFAKYVGITEYYELGVFKIDDMPNDISKALDLIEISGRDLSKDVITSLFTDIKDYSAGATDTALTITSATASNNIGIGDDLVDYDETITYYATINGVRTKVVSSGSYSNASANKFEADVSIDLKATFGVSAITVTSTDTVGTIETSLDGSTWSTFTAGNVRYIRFTIANYDQPNFSINYTDISIVSQTEYPIDNAYDADTDTFYLPTSTKPTMRFSFASGSVNTVLLDWNLTDYKQEAVSYEIGYVNAGTYTKIETVTNVAGRVEHAFTSATADTIRIEMLAGYGALREITLSNVTVTEKFLDEVIEDILTDVGFTDFTNITPTHFYNDALVFHAGDSKSQAISDIADSIGWEFYFDKSGLPVFRPVYYVDPVYTIEYGKDNIFGQFKIEVSDKVFNQIIVINDNAEAGISYTATDDDITSATSTVNIGIRTKIPIRTDKADTVAKAQALAQKELIKAKSERRAFMIQGTALPQLEIYDTIRLIDSTRGIDSLCRIDNITWVGEKSRFTNSMRVVEL